MWYALNFLVCKQHADGLLFQYAVCFPLSCQPARPDVSLKLPAWWGWETWHLKSSVLKVILFICNAYVRKIPPSTSFLHLQMKDCEVTAGDSCWHCCWPLILPTACTAHTVVLGTLLILIPRCYYLTSTYPSFMLWRTINGSLARNLMSLMPECPLLKEAKCFKPSAF